MKTLACGHAAVAAAHLSCPHLLIPASTPDPIMMLTGTKMDYNVLCERCADNEDPWSKLNTVCHGCFARADDFAHAVGWRGSLGVVRRDSTMMGAWTEQSCDISPVNADCVAPLPHGWLVLTATGLVEIPFAPDSRRPFEVVLPAETPDESNTRRQPTLRTSPDGRFAAVVTDHGRGGAVVDLSVPKVTVPLDKGEYHNWTVPFAVAFVADGPETVVVAATDWNRLDAFDPGSGRVLTERETAWQEGPTRSARYLDYFHGRLTPSPSGRWLLDDGWVWGPDGAPLILAAAAWLSGDTYATEQGRYLTSRGYAWNQPVAWVDDDTVAIQRIGPDEDLMIDGVQLFDAATGRRTGLFAGPAGPMWGFGGLLYVSAAEGLERWDPVTGARTGVVEEFHPVAHNAVTGAFAELSGGRLRTWQPG